MSQASGYFLKFGYTKKGNLGILKQRYKQEREEEQMFEFAVSCADFSCGETRTVHWYRTFSKRDEALRYIRNLTGDKNYIQIKDTYSHCILVDERELDFNDNKKPFEEQSFTGYSLELLEIFETKPEK